MNTLKRILIAFPLFLASMLFIANPAQAFSLKSAPTTQITMVASTQPSSELVVPNLTPASHAISDRAGCNCTQCVQSKFHLLQGKLPL
ncbi:hypothetical protein [Nostoc sp. 106C]|jgi:hypothetical protein|uniref:hypothetical protein n=1 Tax=Nostoc sp. 106C TaxID=1932667 RepID=UPI000A38A6E5|nr:hypothetical protein [Nostoc sp. 106C]OUL18904.1 hypothetical protein BV378_34650 [Nostoc sp. RF31YmG]OUL19946.1 hypothetical protein BV375_31600 [Nostoc sp. 106C]